MYEVDFLPVEAEDGPGSKSGDAITARFTVEAEGRNAVVVIDGGFQATGDQVVEHVQKYYGTHEVDLVISTHPDADHINGLVKVIEQLNVGELLVHQPRLHAGPEVKDFSNIEAVDELLATARQHGATVTEPFAGVQRFGTQLRILGPSEGYYKELVAAHLEEASTGLAEARMTRPGLLTKAADLLQRATDYLPMETLTNGGETSPRNSSSVVTFIEVGGNRLLFTGDAGIEALEYAGDEYEALVGAFSAQPLAFFQAPHHGSRHNLGPAILDRMLGQKGAPFADVTSFISSAKLAPKHPSPKVVNALLRRGCWVRATEGTKLWQHSGDAPSRADYVTVGSLTPLIEDDDD
jgi:beta-lactamase superfamily II metal-dependent hydrolase